MANKDFDQSQRNTIWEKYFCCSNSGIDAFGRDVNKNDFECDHVYPKARGGKTTIDNGMPLNPDSNLEKTDNLSGVVNGRRFQVNGTQERGILTVGGIIKTK